jgi:hypothetical protein
MADGSQLGFLQVFANGAFQGMRAVQKSPDGTITEVNPFAPAGASNVLAQGQNGTL